MHAGLPPLYLNAALPSRCHGEDAESLFGHHIRKGGKLTDQSIQATGGVNLLAVVRILGHRSTAAGAHGYQGALFAEILRRGAGGGTPRKQRLHLCEAQALSLRQPEERPHGARHRNTRTQHEGSRRCYRKRQCQK